MNELSLFSGGGGGLLGSKLLGWRTVGYVEKEQHCQKVIVQRIAEGLLDAAPVFGDVRRFIDEGYTESYKGMVDVVSAGFPCQPFSVAGKRNGGAMNGICGRPQKKLSALSGLDTPILKTSPASLGSPMAILENGIWTTNQKTIFGTSEPFSQTWPKSGLMQDGQCWELTTLALPTIEKGSGFWPTPRSGKTTDENEEAWMKRYSEGKVSTPPLSLAIKMYPTPRTSLTGSICQSRCADKFNNLESVLSRQMYPTPRASEGGKGSPNQHGSKGDLTLSSAVHKLWPTPKGSPSGPDFARINRDGSRGDDLATAIARSTWPTPAATDGERGGKMTPNMTGQSLTQMVNSYPTPTSSMATENDFVQAKFHSTKRGKYAEAKFPTPTCDDADNSTLPVSQRDRDNLPGYCLRNGEQPGGQLNPDWVEWLMGWPIGWTSLEPLTELIWLDWSADPADLGEIPRVSTGVKSRVPRLQAIGNGQVPFCFAVAWITLITLIKEGEI